MESYQIRRIEPEDYKDIVCLNNKLGYIYDVERVRDRINNILETGTDIIMVAEVAGNVIGYIHGSPYNTLYADNLLNIVVIVFSNDCNDEIKNELFTSFEKRTIKNGYYGIRMAADIQREDLYDFMMKEHFNSQRDLKHYIKYYKDK